MHYSLMDCSLTCKFPLAQQIEFSVVLNVEPQDASPLNLVRVIIVRVMKEREAKVYKNFYC